MTRYAREGKETNRMLVLGFDAGCGTCAEIARRVEERVGDGLAVRNLGDPELMGWREEALGKDAPWAPTLFEVEGGKVRAWTGKRMALPLSRKLGLSRTWRVMEALGEVAAVSSVESTSTAGKLPVKAAEAVAGMSRGQFLRGVGGAAVAMSVLSGAGSLASAALAEERKPLPYDIVRGVKLSGSQAKITIKQASLAPDTKNLVGNSLSTATKINAATPRAMLLTLRNGTLVHAAAFYMSSGRTVYKYTANKKLPKPLGTGTSLGKLYLNDGGSRILYKGSENGLLWRRPASSSLNVAGVSSLGGCPPVRGGGSGAAPSGCMEAYECVDFQPTDCFFGALGGSSACVLAVGVGVGLIATTEALGTPYAVYESVGGCASGAYFGAKACCRQWRKVYRPFPWARVK